MAKYISISSVASFIGQNNYDYVEPFERLLKKCDSYNKILAEINNKKNDKVILLEKIELETKIIQNDLDTKKISKEEYNEKISNTTKIKESVKQEINNIDNKLETHEEKLLKIVGETTMNILNDTSLTNENKQEILQNKLKESDVKDHNLLKKGTSIINTNYGTHAEDSAIKMFEKKYKVVLDTRQEFFSKKINKKDYDWYICGKVDGLYLDTLDSKKNYIVEVKNRVKSFFNTIRDYEKTQIHLYMELLNIPRAKLVEKFNTKLRVTDIYKDQKYYNEVCRKLQLFIEIFEEFIKNETLLQEFIMNENKRNFIQLNFFNKYEEKSDIESDNECLI